MDAVVRHGDLPPLGDRGRGRRAPGLLPAGRGGQPGHRRPGVLQPQRAALLRRPRGQVADHRPAGGPRPAQRAGRRRSCGRTSTTGIAVTTVVAKVGEAHGRGRPPCASRWRRCGRRSAGPTAPSGRSTRTPNVLRFDVESGSAGEEFREVTLAASFAEGVGLSGRAWRPARPGLRPRPGRGHRLRPRPRRPAGRRPLRCLLPDHRRRPGRRHDGLLRHRDHRAVGVARLGAAQRRSSWSRSGWTSLRAARQPTPTTPARCWRPSSRLREAGRRRRPGRREARSPGLLDDRGGRGARHRLRRRRRRHPDHLRASPTRPTCWRSTPPSRPPAPASSAGLRGRRQRGQGPRPGDRRGHAAGVGADRRHPGQQPVGVRRHPRHQRGRSASWTPSRPGSGRCSRSRCGWRRRSRPALTAVSPRPARRPHDLGGGPRPARRARRARTRPLVRTRRRTA